MTVISGLDRRGGACWLRNGVPPSASSAIITTRPSFVQAGGVSVEGFPDNRDIC